MYGCIDVHDGCFIIELTFYFSKVSVIWCLLLYQK